ncbi:hypothetical protein FOL47_003354, partial [Perkinsus chesapeaki]
GEVVCISDASLEGFGGTCSVLIPGGECRRLWFAVSFGDASISSPVKQLVNPFRQGEYYTSDDIGPLELLGVIVGLLVIPKNDRRLSCTILCDNQSAVSAVNKSYSSVDRMASLLARLAAVKPGDRRLRAFHLPGSYEVSSLLSISLPEVYGLAFHPPGHTSSPTGRVGLWATASTPGATRTTQARPVPHPYSLRPTVRIKGAKNRGIPTVDADSVRTVIEAARAAATTKKYDSIVRRYSDLMGRMNTIAWPLSGNSLVLYITALTREGRVKAETIEDYVGKLRCVNRSSSEDLTCPERELVRLAIQGSKRILGWSEPIRAVTLSVSELEAL